MWSHLPVNRIQSRNNWNCRVLNYQANICQYVVVYFFLFQCVDPSACEYILMQETIGAVEHQILQEIPVNMWCSHSYCFSVWIHCMWTELNLETNGTVEHLIINWFMSICGGLFLSLSVCGCWRLWTQFNLETIGTVEHQILQAMCLSMWWSNSFCFSVWIHPACK